jgi:hypothetical protein
LDEKAQQPIGNGFGFSFGYASRDKFLVGISHVPVAINDEAVKLGKPLGR